MQLTLGEAQATRFDQHVKTLLSRFKSCGITAISGATELAGVVLGDKIGHVSRRSESIVFAAFAEWACLGEPHWSVAEPVSVVVPPPPPPPPVLPEGWCAHWRRKCVLVFACLR